MGSILIVDDSSANLSILLETLSGYDYDILVAKDGSSALRIAEEVHPSLILLDIIMEEMDGYAVFKQLKSNAGTQDIAVIFITALDDTQDKVKGLEMGAADYISKPFQPEEVAARVSTQLKIKELEKALKAKNAQLTEKHRRILEAMREGVIGLSEDACISFVNSAAATMTGWSINELVGKNINILLAEKISDEAWIIFQQVLKKGVVQHIEHGTFYGKNKKNIPVRYSVTPIMKAQNNKKPLGAVIVFSDISEKLQRDMEFRYMKDELQEQKDKLTHMSRLSIMGEMASGFAHEINQPLTAINNYVQACLLIIRRKHPDIKIVINVMDKIAAQSIRAGDIVSRIKNFVRKPQHVTEVVDFNKLICDTVLLAEIDSHKNQINIHHELTSGLPTVMADPVQIQQVLLNLLRNAMESMRDQPTQDIGIWIRSEQLNQNFIKISVIDRGYGLGEDAEEKIFTPFYTTKASGMGIGLSVCNSIIQAHGGELGFSKNPEGGTVFFFTIPVINQQ